MKKFCTAFAAGAMALVGASASQAALIGTNGSAAWNATAGTAAGNAEIIAAPEFALDDNVTNNAIQAFNEQIGYLLAADLAVDGGVVAAGMRVDSHMIFLNSGPGNASTRIEHGIGTNSSAATFTFDGMILGVMSAANGALEFASQFLGATGTTYETGPTLNARGMEANPLVGTDNDYYRVFGNMIEVGMVVTEPGDWIRVVTVSAVPIPASVLLMGPFVLGFGVMARRRRKAATA